MSTNDDFLRGNENLKKPNMVEWVTEEERDRRIRELEKCRNDIVYFAEKYFTIISPRKGKHVIKLYEKQKKLLKAMSVENRVIALASRQIGKTTAYTIYALHQTIFFKEQKIMIAANKRDTAIEILGRIQLAYENVPNWLKPGLLEYNKGSIKFANLSGIQGAATGSSAARGSSAKILILDEFAFVPNNIAEKFWFSVYPIISSDPISSKVIVVSTPNGVGNLYHTLWEKSQTGETDDEGLGWKGVRIDWWDVPGRDERWKKQQIDALGIQGFEQEFGNSFLTSSTPKLIPDHLIQRYRVFIEDHEGFGSSLELDSYKNRKFEIRIFHEYREDRSYLISFDVGNGVGQDYSVAYVWDVTDMTNIIMCARFSDNNTATNEFSYVISKLWAYYGRCWIAGEANSIGKSVIDLLIQLYNVDTFVSMNKGAAGILSHAQIKSKACRFVRNLLSNPEVDIKIYDPVLVDEMEWFVQKDTVKHVLYEALAKKHDDHIIAMIWALFVLNEKDIDNYFSITQFKKTELGETLPLYLQSLLTLVEINYDTTSILDIAYRKQKEKENRYMQRQIMEHQKERNVDYFDRKPTTTGILGKMERLEKMDDSIFIEGQLGFAFGDDSVDW